MSTRVTLKAINGELSKRGVDARLSKGDGYFFFRGGESIDWLDKTVRQSTLSGLTLPQWIAEFQRLKKLNHQILSGGAAKTSRKSRKF